MIYTIVFVDDWYFHRYRNVCADIQFISLYIGQYTFEYTYLNNTRAVVKLLRKRKLKGTWKRYKLLHDWTQQLYFSLHVKYQSHGYTWPIAESIRRASPGGMRSTRTSQTLRQQIKMALLWLWQRQSFSMYTPCNQMHFIWRWTHFSYTYVQLISEVQMLLRCCLAVQYPSQFGEHHIVNSA